MTVRADGVRCFWDLRSSGIERKVGAFRWGRRPGALQQGGLEPRLALANGGRSALACAFIVARGRCKRWPLVGKPLMSVPVSERIVLAANDLMPGVAVTCWTAVRKGA